MNPDTFSPGPLLELSGNYWKTFTLHAAVKLDIFTHLGDQPCPASRVAELIQGDTDAVARLLNALVAMGMLTKADGEFANTPDSACFLSKASPHYVGFMIMHHYHLVEGWHRMDEAILTGKRVPVSGPDAEEWRESFLMGMFNIGMAVAPRLARELDLSRATRLLDLGGGPGTFAVHFCLANPGLSAAVYDLPTTQPFARKIIDQFKAADRVEFMAGNYETEAFPQPGEFDAAWLSHILHGLPPETAHAVVGKAVSALKPGSRIFIHEFILNDGADGPLFPALFSLNMLIGARGGRSYTQAELTQMLKDHGVTDIVRHPFVGPTESGILYGTVG